MTTFRVVFDGEEGDNKVLHIVQRNMRGGAIGDVVTLREGEAAEIELETQGVQLTIEARPEATTATLPADTQDTNIEG